MRRLITDRAGSGFASRNVMSDNGGSRAGGVWIGESRNGRGVFALHDFRAGEKILEFRGNVVDFGTTVRKGDREGDTLQIAAGVYLDLEAPGRFVNHGCDPNAGVCEGVHLIALRDVHSGEEIRFDYCTTMDEDHWTLECECGAVNCRGTVRDFKWLPTRRKLQLIHQNVVPPFLVAREIERGRLAVAEGRIVAGTWES